jgi:hypothetical protein
MLRAKWVHFVLVIILALAALVLIRLHVAVDQPAPTIKGARTCSNLQSECQQACTKSGNPGGCLKVCSRHFQQCLATGCWIGSDFRFCELVKQ